MKKYTVFLIVAAALLVGAGLFAWRTRRLGQPMNGATTRPTTRPSNARMPGWIHPNYNLLARELFRQGLLIAEREAGLPARDRVLEGTGVASDSDPNTWDVAVALIPDNGIDVAVVRNGAPGPSVWNTRIPYKNNWLDYLDLAEKSEGFSKLEFRKAVTPPGATTRAVDASALILSADEVERRLGQVNFIDPFYAVRSAHAAIRDKGETPELLGALVRGYANLGQFTQFMWTAAPKALAARSMLYSQRMIDRWPDSPVPYWHRAYAVAFAGLQGRALQDLDMADRLAAAHAPAGGTPGWVPLLRHFCGYETAALGVLSEKLSAEHSTLAPISRFLGFVTLESSDSASLVNALGTALLTENPDCFRALDRMIEVSGVSFNHSLTRYGPAALMQSLATRLKGLSDLLPGARAALEACEQNPTDLATWATLSTALVDAPAPAGDELPWRALGQLIRETQFVHVWRRTNFVANALGADASREVTQLFPLIADHRYRALVQIHAYSHPGPAEARLVLSDTRVIDPVQTMVVAFLDLHKAGLRPRPDQQEPGESLSYWQWSGRFRDNTSIDFERILRSWVMSERDHAVAMYEIHELQRASPFSPLYMAKLIEYAWPEAEPQVAKWELNRGDHPILTGALGKQMSKLERWPEAESYLKKYLAKAQDPRAYQLLAAAQLNQGHEDQWLATLTAGLQRPDFGLDHAKINEVIAGHYIQQRQFEKAKPYAYEAAGSYSSWGMISAANVEEGLGQWDAAEQWIRRNAQRYDLGFAWFQWCVRTGHGDLAAAEKMAVKEMRVPRNDRAGGEAQVTRGVYALFKGQAAEAESVLADSATRYNDTWSAMQVALMRDAAHDSVGRDAILKSLIAIAEKNPPFPGTPRANTDWVRPAIAALAKVYLATGTGDTAALIRDAEKILADPLTDMDRLDLNYFTGRILECRGDRAGAIKYLKRAAADAANYASMNCALAWIELRSLGVDPAGADSDPADHALAPKPSGL